MTVQAGIEVDTDLELMVGEMPELACEHSQHGSERHAHDDGPAKFYGRGVHDQCGYRTPAIAICAAFAGMAMSEAPMFCNGCRWLGTARELTEILWIMP